MPTFNPVSSDSRFPARTPGWFSILLMLACGASAAPPEIALKSPASLRPGSAAVLTLRGSGLAATRALWTSWSGWLQRLDEEGWECLDTSLKVPVHAPASLPVGIEAVRVLATNGVSNLAWIVIDNLPLSSPTDSPALLEPPVAVEGVMKEADVRLHRLRMNEGQRISMEVLAQRLGSPTDPVLRILDASGSELAYVNDTPGLGVDAALDFQAPATAEYQIEIRDAEYSGGGNSRFRLRVGHFVAGAIPTAALLGVPPGLESEPSSMPWSSAVSGASGSARALIAATPSSGTLFARLDPLRSDRRDSILPRLEVVSRWVEQEREPNETPDTATPIGPGGVRVGRFDGTNDQDWYRLTVSTAGWSRIQVRSRTLGRAADPQLRLSDEAGKPLARASSGDPDPTLFHRFESPGTYLLSLTDAAGRHGPGREYAVVVDLDVGAFQISTESERLHVPVGGQRTLKIKIDSRGYNGPIRIGSLGLPEGFELKNPEVEARKKEWDLVITCGSGVALGSASPVRFVARGTGDKEGQPVALELGPAQRKAFPRMLWVPPGMLDEVWVAAVPGP